MRAPAVERSLALLADVGLSVTAELGRMRISITDMLELEPGAVLQLTQPAGSPVSIFVNGTHFATGEVVVSNDHYALRIISLATDASSGLGG